LKEGNPMTVRDIPIADLMGLVREADVIFGVHPDDPDNRSLFYGESTLKRIARTGNAREVRVAELPVDFDTEDLECLAAAVTVAKGSCCYRGRGEDGDPLARPCVGPDVN
jgi:hypothetical protein